MKPIKNILQFNTAFNYEFKHLYIITLTYLVGYYIELTHKGNTMKKWQCKICELIYDEAEGWPDDGIEPSINSKMYLKTGYALIVV